MHLKLKGKRAFVAGVGDDQGYGWAIAKALYELGADVILGTWTPIVRIFTNSWLAGKFDESRKIEGGGMWEYKALYALDASFDKPEDVPQEIRENKRYQEASGYTISEVAESLKKDFGTIDILVHSLANGPEVKKPLLETSRQGYLAALSSSSYSFVSLIQHIGPLMPKNEGAALSLTYLASEKAVPGYGGGMSSAKAALESDTRTLAFEAGRKWGMRVNVISAGPLRSRAARAIGFIDNMINYSLENAPLAHKEVTAEEIGNAAAFLLSPLASAITGHTMYVDNGMHAMGVAVNSPSLHPAEPTS
jgi:enoyl-[acyl-carrier protein] reductase I